MKKLLFIAITVLGSVSLVNAQEISKHAIGLRLGANSGLGYELSYQHKLGEKTRLEGDLGIISNSNYSAFKLIALHQWVFPLKDSFNWYAGAGLGVTNFTGKNELKDQNDTGIFLAGDIGIEYLFDFPLQLSLDLRPELAGANVYTNNTSLGFALGARYRF